MVVFGITGVAMLSVKPFGPDHWYETVPVRAVVAVSFKSFVLQIGPLLVTSGGGGVVGSLSKKGPASFEKQPLRST